MTPAQIAEARRYHDFALAALAVRLEVTMEEVRAAVSDPRPHPAAETEPSDKPAPTPEVTPGTVESVAPAGGAEPSASPAPDEFDEPIHCDGSRCHECSGDCDRYAQDELPERLDYDPADPLRSEAASLQAEPERSPPAGAPIPPATVAQTEAEQSEPVNLGAASQAVENAASESAEVTTPNASHSGRGEAGSGSESTTPALRKLEQVRLAHEEHPDWSKQQIADHIGISLPSVAGHLSHLGIKGVPKRHDRELVPPPMEPAKQAKPPAPAKPEPSHHAFAPIDEDEPSQTIRRPKGTQFRLTDGDGNYLHWGCEDMVKGIEHAWVGTEKQLAGCRRVYPLARNLTERVVHK